MIYLWKCTTCGYSMDIERPIAECTVPPDTGCPPWESLHEPKWQRIYEAPMQTRESYPDGHKRKGWTELREAQKLERIAAVTGDRSTKQAIKAEIRKMGIKPSEKG